MGVHKDNIDAARFYERHGFVKTEAMEGNDYYFFRYPSNVIRDRGRQVKFGYDVFGKAYGVMLRNDLHSPRSIDHIFLKTMILLDDDSYHSLYRAAYCQTDMAEHELYDFSQQFKRKTDSDTIDAVLEYTSSIAKNYDVPLEEMLFGGTEKQIIERGTDWCADMARVCCVILKCLNIPCRILHIVDSNKAYNGHVVCEAFYENEYGVIDPIYGFRFYSDTPINGYYLLKNHNEFSLGYDGYMNLYSAIAINEYDPLGNNDYSITRPNEYCSKIINTDHNDKWFMGEDEESIIQEIRG